LEAIGSPSDVLNPETILSVYGVDVAVRRDPFTHGIYVMPRSVATSARKNGARVHVLCGGGSGGPILRQLIEHGFSLSAGVLNVLDSDYECAVDLHIPVVAEVPFSQISDEADRDNLSRIDDSKAVVVSRFPVGPGNFKNLVAARHALDIGKKVYLVSGPGAASIDFIGGRADAYLRDLVSAGAVEVPSVDELVRLLGAGLEAQK
jgi:iron complex transport system ATP-binding protein